MQCVSRTLPIFTHSLRRHLGCIQRNHRRHWKSPGRCSLSTTASINGDNNGVSIPKDASVVICGGGIAGVSVAYHLAKKGLSDVLLLDQGSLTCGTTWHSAGLVGLIKGNSDQRELARISANLYEGLEAETGLSTGFKRTGAVYLAASENRMVQLRRLVAIARTEGAEVEMLTPAQLSDLVPWISTTDVLGGIYSPQDGVTDPTDTVMSLARGAKSNGAKLAEKVSVKSVLTTNGKVSGVITDQGHEINCEYFVNAAGIWSRSVGQMSNPTVTVPVQTNQHQYAIFKPKEGVNFNTPYVRNWDSGICIREWSEGLMCGNFASVGKPIYLDGSPPKSEYISLPEDWEQFDVRNWDSGIYIREWSEGLMCGNFASVGKPIYLDGSPPKSEYISLPEDWEQFDPNFKAFLDRVPCAENLELKHLFSGPEGFTPDMRPIIGEAPNIKNYFVSTGMHSQGVTFGGSIGSYLADWIVDGKPPKVITSMDITRFAPRHNKLEYVQDRSRETEGLSYKMQPPNSEFQSGRKLCCTALYNHFSEHDAEFGEIMGIEHPLFFKSPGGELSGHHSVWGKPYWFDSVLSEYLACRDSVGVFDTSAMAVCELQSKSFGACSSVLQTLCSSNVPSIPGSVTSTWMLNDEGNIINDCLVACLDRNRYMILSPVQHWISVKSWIERHLPNDKSIVFKDLSPGSEDYEMGRYTVLSVMGPKAESVLNRLVSKQMANYHINPVGPQYRRLSFEVLYGLIHYMQYGKDGHILTTSLAGNTGFLLMIPSENAEAEYTQLMETNRDLGITNAGYHAFRWMRGGNCIPTYGVDFDANSSPLEVTLQSHPVDLYKHVPFIGQAALQQRNAAGAPTVKQLAQFTVELDALHNDVWPWGMEPIFYNDRLVGSTTSTSYKASSGKLRCFGMIEEDSEKSSIDEKSDNYEIDIDGKIYAAERIVRIVFN